MRRAADGLGRGYRDKYEEAAQVRVLAKALVRGEKPLLFVEVQKIFCMPGADPTNTVAAGLGA
jgi:hypothetical protein